MKALCGITLAVVLCLGCGDLKKGDKPGDSNPGGNYSGGGSMPNGGAPNGNGNGYVNPNPGGPLWVVLSNFRTSRRGKATEVSVDYRVVSGSHSVEHVIRIQQPISVNLVEYVDLQLPAGDQGTVKGNFSLDPHSGGNCVAIFGKKDIFSGGFKAYSGRLFRGGPATSAQPPRPSGNVAGGPGNGQPGQNQPPGVNPPNTTYPGSNRPGYNRPGYNRPTYNRPPYTRSGSNRTGTSRPPYNRPRYTRPGSNRPGYRRPGTQPPPP